MPYKRLSDLPKPVREYLPKGAQEIFKEAYNNAEKQYKSPLKRRGDATLTETANKVAWSAVKKQYSKGRDEKWHRKI